jgi:PAS domain S-box-containing protein
VAETIHILILEDNPADADLVQFELQEAGIVFTPKVVTTKKDYVRELQEFSPDLILSDYDLPQYNGFLALAEARKSCPDTPFILVTGAVSEDRAIEILTQGAKDYVLKTRLQQRLAPAVRRALAETEELKARKKAEDELRETYKSLERQVAQRTAELQQQLNHGRNIEKALLKYNERLELLSYISSRLLTSDKPQQLVEELCLKVMEFLDCQAFFNFLVDDSAGRLHLNACAGIPPETAREIEWLDFGVAVCGCVARDGLRIIAENIPKTPDVRTELIKSFGIKAYACHPLLQQNKVIGTLSFGTRTRTTFSADDLALMKAVTDQVAIAMSRVRSENTLRQITDRFEMAQHAAEVGTWDWDIITGSIEWSDQMFNLFGLDPQKNKASFGLWETVLYPDDVKIAGLRIEEALKKKITLNSDYRIILPDGQIRWINSIGEGKYNDQNQAIRMIGICADITDRKQAEMALRENEEKYRLLVSHAPTAIYEIDFIEKRFKSVNDEMCRMSGYTEEELLSMNPLDILDRESGNIFVDRIIRAQAGEQPTQYIEYKGKRKDGSEYWGILHNSFKYNEGKIVGAFVIAHDITARKKTEEALRESEERYRELVQSSPEAVIVHRDGQFLYANPAALRLYGAASLDQLQTKTVLALIPADEQANIALRMKKGKAGDKLSLRETKLTRLDGQAIEVESVGGAITYNGNPAMQIFIREITARKNADNAVQVMLQRLQALVSNLHSSILFVRESEIELANQIFCDYFGLQEIPADLIGLSASKMIEKIKDAYLHPEEEIIRIREIIDRGEPVVGEEIAMHGGRTCLRDYIPIFVDGKSYGRLWQRTDITMYKQAEADMRESEERYRHLFENHNSAVILTEPILDEDGRLVDLKYLTANPAVSKHLNKAPEEMVGRLYSEVFHYPGRNPVFEIYEQVLSTGEPYKGEILLPALNRHYDIAVYRPAPSQLALVLSNITERKQAEEALRLTQQRLSVIVDSIADGFFAVDRQWHFTHINDEALKHFHKTRDEVIGRNLFEVFPQSRGTNFETNYRQAMESSKPVHFEAESTIADMALEIFAYPGPENMTVLFRDITEKNRQAKELAEYHERAKWLSRFPEENPNPIVRVADDGMVLYCNSSSSADPGWACKVGAPLNEALMPAFNEAVSKKREVEREIMIGALHYVVTVTPFPVEAYANIYGREITKRKIAEEALRDSEKMKSELLANLNEAQHMAMIGSWDWDLRTNRVWWSDESYRIFGVTPQNFVPGFEANGKFIHPDDFDQYNRVFEHSLQTGEPLDFDLRLVTGDGVLKYCNAKGKVIFDDESHPLRFVGTIMDITESSQREKEREKNNRTLRALSKSNQTLMRATDENGYMADVCKILIEDCGYAMLWIGFAENDEGKTVRPVAYSGFEEGYIDTLKITWADTERGHGPTGTAIRTGKLTACRNMLTDPNFEPWRKEAIKRGYSSSIVLPLMDGDKAFGALTIYSREPDPFSDEEEKLLSELAGDLAYGIMTIRWREALRQSEERFHAIATHTPDHILMQDRDLRYQLVINPQLGLTETAMLGKTDYDILEREDAERLTAIKRNVIETGESVSMESSVENLHGEPEYFEGAYVPKHGPAGQTEGIIGYFRNITKRKLTEDALRDSETKFRMLAESSTFAIIMHQGDSWIYANPAAKEISGYGKDDLDGMHFWDIVHPDHKDMVKQRGLDRQQGKVVPDTYEFKIITKSGKEKWVSLTGTAIKYKDKPTVLLSIIDITERKLAEEQLAKQAAQLQESTTQLEAANRELESFSYSVSHDLRAPLRAIDGFSRKLEREYGGKIDEKATNVISVIRNNVKLMVILIENLLSFSRVQKIDIKNSVIDMDKLAREVWDEIKEANKERQLNLKIKKILPGYGDHALIKQVLFNLLSNAVKFTKNKEKGIIEVSSHNEADKVVYCIKDNGAGFDMEYYDKLFNVFQRLHSHEEYEGTGVGLAIVQRIINRHGGRVWAEGTVDKGATFYFTLPEKY